MNPLSLVSIARRGRRAVAVDHARQVLHDAFRDRSAAAMSDDAAWDCAVHAAFEAKRRYGASVYVSRGADGAVRIR